MNELATLWEGLPEPVKIYGPGVLTALLILLIGLVFSRLLPRAVRKVCRRTATIDETLTLFFVNLTKVLVWLATLLLLLPQFGIQTASLIALFGAVGLGVGLALKDTLTDLADGIILLVLRPFSVGDFVETAGTSGVVTEIGFFATRLRAPDGTFTLVTNSQVWGDVIHNKSVNPTRRIDLQVGIGYKDDVEEALAVLRGVVDAEPRVLPDPEPLVAVESLGDSSVNLLARVWTTTPDWWQTQLDLRKEVKHKLDAAGIEIPFPQRDLHIVTDRPSGDGAQALTG